MILNVFGSTERRRAAWDARYASPVITLFGNTELDFRDARLEAGETAVVIISLAGGVEVIVPDDLPVLVSGVSLLGDRQVLGQSSGGVLHGTDFASPDFGETPGRRLRLTIISLLGGVEVRQRPAETSSVVSPMAA